jgi:DTW domain-containing protein YfiP
VAETHGDEYRKHARCPVCRLTPLLCVCATLPRIDLPVRVLLIQHHKEREKQSNTGRLAHRLLSNSELVYFGARDEPFAEEVLQRPGTDYRVLHPLPGARPLEPGDLGRRSTLVVLDGTWRQARRMTSRVPGIAELPFVTLPDDGRTPYQPRRAPAPGRYSTIDAIANALRVAGYEEAADRMEQVLRAMRPRLDHVRAKTRRRSLEGTQGE